MAWRGGRTTLLGNLHGPRPLKEPLLTLKLSTPTGIIRHRPMAFRHSLESAAPWRPSLGRGLQGRGALPYKTVTGGTSALLLRRKSSTTVLWRFSSPPAAQLHGRCAEGALCLGAEVRWHGCVPTASPRGGFKRRAQGRASLTFSRGARGESTSLGAMG